jgi:hypothetical protein
MSAEQLEKELRSLSQAIGKDPSDDDLQNRFADVRFEIRKRAKTPERAREEPVTPPPQSTQPRAIEIPDDVERRVPRASEAEQLTKPEPRSTDAVKGFTADVRNGSIMLSYQARTAGGGSIVQVATMLSVEDAETFVAMLKAQIVRVTV